MPVEIDEKELEELRASKAEAAEAKKQHAAEVKARKEGEARHTDELNRVAAYLEQQEQARRASAETKPAVEEDEGSFVTRKDVKAELERVRAESQHALAEETRQTLSQQRHQNRERVAADPYFVKYKDEIEEALNQVEKMNPRAAAQPGAYGEAIKLAKARHLDEIEAEIREKVNAEAASRPRDDDDEEEERPRAARPAVAASPSTSGASPGGASTSRPVSLVRASALEPLDPREDRIRRKMGVTVEDWRKHQETPDDYDPFGFHGRSRV